MDLLLHDVRLAILFGLDALAHMKSRFSSPATTTQACAKRLCIFWGGVEAAATVRFSGRFRGGNPFRLVAGIGRMCSNGIECRTPVIEGIAEYVDWFQMKAASA